jgi:uncharacterized metal-binding protein YceD (DUF177 family)
MRIKLGEINDRGLDVHAGMDDAWARESAAQALEGEIREIFLKARAQTVSDCVRIFGELRAVAHRDCDRCQASLRLELGGSMDLYYSPPRPGEGGDRDLDVGDLDIGWFDGEALDLAQVISEQLAIWCPDCVTCEVAESTRLEPDESPCEVLTHDGGPELKRESPFAGLRLPD